jgi:hypothetical protein
MSASTTNQAWALDHNLAVLAQTESRPGPITDEGERWMERKATGKAMVVCACGYSAGLVDRSELPTNEELAPHHHPRI